MMKYMLLINIFTYRMRNMKFSYYGWGKNIFNHILSYFENISSGMFIHVFNYANIFSFLNIISISPPHWMSSFLIFSKHFKVVHIKETNILKIKIFAPI
jgi:hypothetical protein